MPKKPYKHKPSQNGNRLFAKLPAEIRCKIWYILLVKRGAPVVPVHIPRDTATETFFSMEDDHNITFVLNTILRTCRLFYQDQEEHMIFYKFNEFQFYKSRDCLTYVAAITPSRRNAIRNITFTLDHPTSYNPDSVKKKKPGDRLRAIARLCPNLRVLRHEKFFYRADSLANWAIVVAETLSPIVASLPLLQEVYINGGNGTYTQVECHMTTQIISFTWQELTLSGNYNWTTRSTRFSERGEKVLTAVWEMLSKRKTVHEQPLEPRRVKQAIATTPILTLGQNRRHQSRVNGVSQNVGPLPIVVPDYIFGGFATVGDIRIHRNHAFPHLRIDMIWYPWDAVFHSSRLSESSSKRYMAQFLLYFKSKYVSWVYCSGTSKGRRHGNRSPQSKLINCIWRLNWQDKAAKLEILKGLYRERKWRPKRRRWQI